MSRKVNEISDEQLFKCMKDFLDDPTRYHPEYLQLLMNDYERRLKERIEHHGGPPPPRTPLCSNITTIAK
jgi:hypothetical protein